MVSIRYKVLLAIAVITCSIPLLQQTLPQKALSVHTDVETFLTNFTSRQNESGQNNNGAQNTTSVTDVSYMSARLRHKVRACKNLTALSKHPVNNYRLLMFYARPYNLSYCGVGKVGGTFFKQLLFVLAGDKMQSIQPLTRLQMHQKSLEFRKPLKNTRDTKNITVARNPYSRLYSAYIDRVSVPSIDRPIRKGAMCKFDVTFEDFLKLVISHTDTGRMDPHWSPIYYICKPCSVTSTYIIKQETFTSDIQYLLESLNLPDNTTRVINQILKESRTEWTITGMVKDFVKGNANQEYKKPGCVGRFAAIQKQWHAFQVTGYIDDKINLTEKMYHQANNMTDVDDILQTIFTTIQNHPLTHEQTRLQRHQALVKAYANIPNDVIKGLQRVFKPDFEMFNYSNEPPNLKPLSLQKRHGKQAPKL